MAEEAAATATATTPATATAAGTNDAVSDNDKALGPEGEKALAAFKSRARTAEQEAKELRERLEKLEESNKSDTDKALDKARKDARKEAEAEFQKERRSDRLGVAVAKHARELADVDDVVLNLERGDTSDLFDDDHKVKPDALKQRLDELLKAKPHLKATGVGKPAGDADGGKGEGGEGRSFNDVIRAKARGH